jgi:hypothetical protein
MSGDRRRGRIARLLGSAAVLVLVAGALVGYTQSAFSGTTADAGNSFAAGTVVLTDDDSGSSLFTMTGGKPGDSQTSCINVGYGGTLGAQVRLRAATGGTGLGAYLTLKVTRGTFASPPGSGSCTGFTADSSAWIGAGAGVVYDGTLTAFPSTWAAGLKDPWASDPEIWTSGESHAYQVQLTVQDTNAAQGLTVSTTFTWEARDSSAPGSGSYYAQAVLQDNPASFWRLGETNGTTVVDLKGAANGTYQNGVTLGRPGPLRDGVTAPAFDGINDRIALGDVYDFADRSPYSVELWFNRTTLAEDRWNTLLTKEDAGQNFAGWNIGVLKNDPGYHPLAVYTDRLSTTGEDHTYTSVPVSAAAWHHIVVTYDGNTLRIYLDGSLSNSRASTTGVTNTPATLYIGGDALDSEGLNGSIADVAVYGSALSATQVAAHFNARY